MEAYLVLSSLHHPLNRSSAQKGSSPINVLGIGKCRRRIASDNELQPPLYAN